MEQIIGWISGLLQTKHKENRLLVRVYSLTWPQVKYEQSYKLPQAAGLGQQLQAEGLGQAARRGNLFYAHSWKKTFRQ